MIKRSVKSGDTGSRKRKNPTFKEGGWRSQPITFDDQDLAGATGPQGRALIAEMRIGGQDVEGVLFDTGSEPNVLCLHAYERMKLDTNLFRPFRANLYGFNNAPTGIEGSIVLPVMAGQGRKSVTIPVEFLVARVESPYNAILGRPFLHSLRGIISQAHMCIKFPTPGGVGIIKEKHRSWQGDRHWGYAESCSAQDTHKRPTRAARRKQIMSRKQGKIPSGSTSAAARPK